MKLRLTRLQMALLGLGVAMTFASIFAPWFTLTHTDGEKVSLGGLQFIREADYYLFYSEGAYGTIYSPLIPLVLIIAAASLEVFSVRYAPTLLSSLALGAVIGNLVKLLRFSCDVCGVTDIAVAPGVILALVGSALVVAATFLEGKPVDEGTGEVIAPAEPADTGEDDADEWFEQNK